MAEREHRKRGRRRIFDCPAADSGGGFGVGRVVTVAGLRRMPVPVAENWDWQMEAACRTLDSEVFFHPSSERGAHKDRRDAQAKQVCRSCPVIDDCRRYALATHEAYGVWGGLTAAERDVYQRQTAAAASRRAAHQTPVSGHETR